MPSICSLFRAKKFQNTLLITYNKAQHSFSVTKFNSLLFFNMDNLDFNTLGTTRHDDLIVASLMRNVYLWMTAALVITGLCALLTAKSQAMITFLFTNPWAFIALVVAELALVFILSARIGKMSFETSTLMFIGYSALNGVMLSSIFIVYSLSSIATTFFICAGSFAVLAGIGTVTKKDLSVVGKFCYMAVIGLIIAAVVNMFLHNTLFDLLVSAIGVLIFAGLTAYDSQKIRQMLEMAGDVNEGTMKLALMGSLSLYLDFINLFLYLLRFFGRRD